MKLTAFYFDEADLGVMPIIPASSHRDWIRNTHNGYARYCLPMLIANQTGWQILNPGNSFAVWNGGDDLADLKPTGVRIHSMFGYGIVTFVIPYLFRTEPGWQLYVKGPANLPKIGVIPLEGIVETDWSPVTFTMNWKFTRPGMVSFEEGEPICQIFPIKLDDVAGVEPSLVPITDNQEEFDQYVLASEARTKMRLRQDEGEDVLEGSYMRGTSPGGKSAGKHFTRLPRKFFQKIEGN